MAPSTTYIWTARFIFTECGRSGAQPYPDVGSTSLQRVAVEPLKQLLLEIRGVLGDCRSDFSFKSSMPASVRLPQLQPET